jgi:lysophospholipase L1-like esterase
MDDLLRGGHFYAGSPTTDTGFRSYGMGRLFLNAADGLNDVGVASDLRYQNAVGTSGYVAMRISPNWAPNDGAGHYLAYGRNVADDNYAWLMQKSTSNRWNFIVRGSAAGSCVSAVQSSAVVQPHTLVGRWDTTTVDLNHDGTTAPQVGHAQTIAPSTMSLGEAYPVADATREASGYEGPVICGSWRPTDAWVNALQANGGAAFSDLMQLCSMMAAGDHIYPLNGDSRYFVKGSGAAPFEQDAMVVFDGDSLTTGYPGTDGNSYPAQLVASLSQTVVRKTAATNGDRLANMLAGAAADVDVWCGAHRKRNICVVWGGTNDIADGRSPVDIYADITSYVNARKAVGFKVVIFTIIPRTTGSDADRLTLNGLILGNAAGADLVYDPCADTHFDSQADVADGAIYADATHLTTAGYGVIAGGAKTPIESLLTA